MISSGALSQRDCIPSFGQSVGAIIEPINLWAALPSLPEHTRSSASKGEAARLPCFDGCNSSESRRLAILGEQTGLHLCNNRRREISSWRTRHFLWDNDGIVKCTYAENDPVMRTARGSSPVLLGKSSLASGISPSQSLSTLTFPSRSFMGGFRPLRYLTTGGIQCFDYHTDNKKITHVRLTAASCHSWSRSKSKRASTCPQPGSVLPNISCQKIRLCEST